MNITEGWERRHFTHEGKRRTLFWRGSGPGVVVMHELTGLTTETLALGERVAAAGYTAVLPLLFGEPGVEATMGQAAVNLVRVCISREFAVLAKHAASPITDWLRALCREVHAACGGAGVGVIGLCLTGGFGLAMMVDETIMAPVLSQPSLPFGVTEGHRQALGVSAEALARVQARVAGGCPVLGLRFTHDRLSPPERFETLRELLGEGFVGIEIDSSPGNPHGIPAEAHSVLTGFYVDEPGHPTHEAFQRVLVLFRERLDQPPPSIPTAP